MPKEGKAADGAAKKSIDPRYDPAFQRGFRGETRKSARTSDYRRDKPLEREAQFRVKHSDPTVSDARVDPAEGEEFGAEAAIENDADLDSELDGDVADTAAPPSRFNPYIVALWIIGIGLTVIGLSYQIWAQSHSGSIRYNSFGGTPLDVVLINIAYAVSTPMITIGLATVVGLLFLLAARSRHWPRR